MMLSGTHGEKTLPPVQLVWLAGWAAGVVFSIIAILWSLTGKTIVTLDQDQLQIATRIMGLQPSTRTYANAEVRNLRFIPAMMRARTNRPSGIWFEANGKLKRFASAVTDTEASVLIEKMHQVYNFPKDSSGGAFGVPE